MKSKLHLPFVAFALFVFATFDFRPITAFAQSAAFIYEGQLSSSGQPVNNPCDFTFALFNNSTGAGGQVGSTLTNLGVNVNHGQFAVTLDFGNVFTGANYWLAIAVRNPHSFLPPAGFTAVAPLQPILAAPYASYAHNAGSANFAASSGSATYAANSGVAAYADNAGSAGFATNSGNAAFAVNAGSAAYAASAGSAAFASDAGTVSASNIVGSISAAQLPPGVITNNAPSLTLPPNLPVSAAGSVDLDIGGNYQALSVAVAGNYAYVVTYNDSLLEVVDISTPSAPAVVGSARTQGGSRSVAVAGRYAYVVNYASASNLQIFDVSNPSAPTLVGSGPGGYERSVAVSGKYAYLTGDDSALQVFDVSNPSAPVRVATSGGDAGGGGTAVAGIAVTGRYAYVTSGQNALQIFDVSNPTAPISVGSVGSGGGLALAVAGRYAYVANNNGETLLVIDIASPSAPTIVGSYSTGYLGVGSMVVAGHYLYKTTYQGQTLQVIDVSNPSSPLPVGSVSTSGISYCVAVSGRGAYVLVDNTLQVFDLGGACIQQLEAGTIHAGTLQVNDTVNLGNSLSVNGGLTVGAGVNITGNSTLTGNDTFAGNETFIGNNTFNVVSAKTLVQTSDRAAKEKFSAVDPTGVLDKVLSLPITEWNFRSDDAVRHLGPMAQDFYTAFGLGSDDKHIATVDEEGVALAAIQGLNERLEQQLKARDAEIKDLNDRLEKLEKPPPAPGSGVR